MTKTHSQANSDSDNPDQPKLRLRAKLIWYSIPKGKVSFVEMHLLLLFSYLQIFFLTARFIRKFGIDTTSQLRDGFQNLENLITLSGMFGFSRQDNGIFAAYAIIVCYFLITIITPLLLIRSICAYQQPSKLVIVIWGALIRYHNPLIFFLIHDLCGRIQEEYSLDNLDLYDSDALNQLVFILSLIFTVINIALSFVRTALLHDFLPKKILMSSKNSSTDQITLLQKMTLPILYRFLSVDTFSTILIIALNTCFCLLKIYWYYTTFPRYNIKALKFNAYMITVEASIVLFTPILFILNAINSIHISVTDAEVMIVMLLPFLLFFTKEIVNRGLSQIIYSPPNQVNPHKLIHRLILLKQMRSHKGRYDEVNAQMDVNLLYFTTLATHVGDVFDEEEKEVLDMDFHDKEVQNTVIRLFLERLVKAYPHDSLLKLSLIKFYCKTLKLFSLAINHLSKFQSFSPRVQVSKELLYFEIEESISTYFKGANSAIDTAGYLVNQNKVEEFKQKIYHQLHLQKHFWNEYSKSTPDTFKLYRLSKEIEAQKHVILTKWNNQDFNKEYARPFLLYASYLLVLNDSLQEGMRYIKSYNLFNPRVKGEESNAYVGLSAANLYSDETFYITVKTDEEHVGIIHRVSSSIKKTLHFDPKALVGQNINNLMSDYLARNHNDILLKYVETGKTKILNYVRSIFVKDFHGYLHKASIYTRIHPFFSQDLYLTALIRPLKSYEEYMVITPQGIIDSTSYDIGTVLGLEGKKVPMSNFCKEFEGINEVFNYFGYKDIKPDTHGGIYHGALSVKNFKNEAGENIDPKKEEMYNKWCVEGGELRFLIPSTAVNNNRKIGHQYRKSGNFVTFFCKIYNYWYANDFFKVVVIERANHLEEEYQQFIENQTTKQQQQALRSQLQQMHQQKQPKPQSLSQIQPQHHPQLVKKKTISLKGILKKKSSDFSDIDEMEEYKKHVRLEVNSTEVQSPHGISPSHRPDKPVAFMISPKNIKDLQTNLSLESCRDDFTLLKGLLSPHSSIGNNLWENNEKKKEDSPTNNTSSQAVQVDIRPQAQSVASGSQVSSISREGRAFGEIRRSLKKRNYSKSALLFVMLCLLLSLGTFIAQIYIRESVSHDLDELGALGSTIDTANTAIDALLILNRGARTALEEWLDIIDTAGNPTAEEYMKSFLDSLAANLPILKEASLGLWNHIQNIDQKFRILFTEETIVFNEYNSSLEIESERYVDFLNGMTLILNRLYSIQEKFTNTDAYDPADLMYVMRNGCSDLLVQNKELAQLISDNLNVVISRQHNHLNTVYGLCIGMVVLMLGIAVYFCYKFYQDELLKMRFFLRVKDYELEWIKLRLDNLDKALNIDEYHEALQDQGMIKMDMTTSFAKTISNSQKKVKTIFKEPEMSSVLRKYLLKIGLWVIILLAYIALLTSIYVVVYNQADQFNFGLNRLMTLQDFMEKIQVSVIGFYALFIPQYDTTIENTPIETAFKTNMAYLARNSEILASAYKKNDGTIDSTAYAYFNGNVCKFVSDEDLSKCLLAASGLDNFNIFTLLSALQSHLQSFSDQYLGSDRSAGVSQDICTNGFVQITPFSLSARDVLLYMIAEARVYFEDVNQSLKDRLVVYLVVTIIVFWILFVMSWKYVISYLINSPNRVKIMLMIIPVNIMATNKAFKSLIVKCFGGNFAVLKGEI